MLPTTALADATYMEDSSNIPWTDATLTINVSDTYAIPLPASLNVATILGDQTAAIKAIPGVTAVTFSSGNWFTAGQLDICADVVVDPPCDPDTAAPNSYLWSYDTLGASNLTYNILAGDSTYGPGFGCVPYYVSGFVSTVYEFDAYDFLSTEMYFFATEPGTYTLSFEFYSVSSIQSTLTGTTWLPSVTINVAAPSATISDGTVAGVTDTAMSQDVTITLANDTFLTAPAVGSDVSDWFTNLPAGLTATVKSAAESTTQTATATTVVVTISGTPTATSTDALSVEIPTSLLAASSVNEWGKSTGDSGGNVTAAANANALYSIMSDDASVSGVTVDGTAATVDSSDDTTYDVELPTGTVLANLVAGDIVVTPTDTNASVGTPATADGGATWTVEVTAEDGTTTETYTINVTVAAAEELVSITAPAAVNVETGDASTTVATIAAYLGGTVEIVTTTGTTTTANVTWDNDTTPAFDVNTDGTYVLTGTVTLPANVYNTAGVSLTVSVNVIVASNADRLSDAVDAVAAGDFTDLGILGYDSATTSQADMEDAVQSAVDAILADLGTGVTAIVTYDNATSTYEVTLSVGTETPVTVSIPASDVSFTAIPILDSYSISVTKDNTATLSVTDDVAALSGVTYQWYSSASAGDNTTGTAISGATGSTYSPDTSVAGTYYYYVVVTYDNVDYASDVATVKVTASSTSSSGGGTSSIKYTITATAGTGGSISPASVSVYSGSSKTFTITADDGYVISDVLVDGVSVGAVSSYTFKNVKASHTIKAIFAEVDTESNTYTGYDDVSASAWYYDAVCYVTELGLFNGTGGNNFSPDAPMTRAMFVTVLGRYAESVGESISGYSNGFNDVSGGQWYTNYVSWASTKGIVKGYSDTLFGPNDSITREQMAAIIVRFADYMGIKLSSAGSVSYSDASSISDWAAESVKSVSAAAIMQGSSGMFRPLGTATRAEVAQVLMNLIESIG